MATTIFVRISNRLAMTVAATGIALIVLASAALADTPNRAGDVKQASQPIRLAAHQQESQPEEIVGLGPRNFGPVEPPVEVIPAEFVPAVAQPLDTDAGAEQVAWVYGHHYYGGYYGAYYRPYAYGYPYASYYRPYYAYPYHYNYYGNYVPRYVGYYSPYPYVSYYSPSPYVGYGYRPYFVAPPVVYGGCYYW